jgi:hypothetical protein
MAMDKLQRGIVSVVTFVVIGILTFGFASYLFDVKCPYSEQNYAPYYEDANGFLPCDVWELRGGKTLDVYAFDFEKTWIIWMLGLFAIFGAEMLLFNKR